MYLGGKEEVNEEESDEDDEAEEGLVRKQGWSERHETAGDHLMRTIRLVTTIMLHWSPPPKSQTRR